MSIRRNSRFNPDQEIPVFIRGGKVLIIRDRIRRSSTLMENDPVTMIIALGRNGEAQGDLYFDDGITHDYINGEFSYKNAKFENNLFNYRYGL